MHNKYSFEFSKIYKRLMALEIVMKENAITSIINVYGNNSLNEFSNFFNNKETNKHYKRDNENKILKIIQSKATPETKIRELINILYLNHLLSLTLTFKQFFNDDIATNFYVKKPEKFQLLKDNRKHIRDLRNDIAHYNFERYEKNKHLYFKALLIFEIHMGCNIATLAELPEFSKKLSIKEILLEIQKQKPHLFSSSPEDQEYFYNKDRILIELFDDFAIINGWQYSELPSPWSVLRQKYDTIKSINNNSENTKTLLQPKLF